MLFERREMRLTVVHPCRLILKKKKRKRKEKKKKLKRWQNVSTVESVREWSSKANERLDEKEVKH
jgi:hypothetical protein